MDSFDNHAVDESESTQHSCTDSQTMSTETSDKTFNKNIEDLKKLDIPNNFESVFAKYDVYSIFNRIAKENDFDALNFSILSTQSIATFLNIQSTDRI